MESMSMPVIVGLLVAVMFLVAFSQWFYNIISGWREIIVDDLYVIYRIAGATIVSMAVMFAGFWVIATINECDRPLEEREGIFKKLKCEEYWEIRTGTEELFLGED